MGLTSTSIYPDSTVRSPQRKIMMLSLLLLVALVQVGFGCNNKPPPCTLQDFDAEFSARFGFNCGDLNADGCGYDLAKQFCPATCGAPCQTSAPTSPPVEADLLYCLDGPDYWYSASLRCDWYGYKDCASGSDEWACPEPGF